MKQGPSGMTTRRGRSVENRWTAVLAMRGRFRAFSPRNALGKQGGRMKTLRLPLLVALCFTLSSSSIALADDCSDSLIAETAAWRSSDPSQQSLPSTSSKHARLTQGGRGRRHSQTRKELMDKYQE